jgi:hypothetical protein
MAAPRAPRGPAAGLGPRAVVLALLLASTALPRARAGAGGATGAGGAAPARAAPAAPPHRSPGGGGEPDEQRSWSAYERLRLVTVGSQPLAESLATVLRHK